MGRCYVIILMDCSPRAVVESVRTDPLAGQELFGLSCPRLYVHGFKIEKAATLWSISITTRHCRFTVTGRNTAACKMSARNLTALGFSVGIGVITGSFSPCHKDNICQVLRNPTGVYIFKPTLQEQSELWRNPGYVVLAQVLTRGTLVNLKQ